jgi:hypothetical protein
MRRDRIVLLAFLVLLARLSGTASAEITACFAPSATKVLRDTRIEPAVHSWELATARNETEACQLVLHSDKPIAGVVVSVSDFRHVDNTATLKLRLFQVGFVPKIVGDASYPDPLPPLKPLDLQANQAQPVWISVTVPKDAKPGDYAATVQVHADGRVADYPLRLHVWGFTLPETPSCMTAFGLSKEYIAREHGVAVDSPESERLYAQYYEELLAHRISANTIPADLMSDDAAKYLNDPRLTSYLIPYLADDNALKALVARLTQHGWYAKGFFYPIDEPVHKEAYDQLATISERLHQCVPGYRWVVPYFRDPGWSNDLHALDLMANRVNVWCPQLEVFDKDPRTRSYLADRRKLGDDVWWYVCCGPGLPYNNFFINLSAMTHRLLFWQQKRENVQGLLYWRANYWNPSITRNPWTDMATVKDINAGIMGDGSLFYPGKQVGVDGPVSSLRLEVIRDGLEDFDYLTLADAWLGKETTLKFVTKMARSLKDYEQNPRVLEETRRELGNLLEKNAPSAKTP